MTKEVGVMHSEYRRGWEPRRGGQPLEAGKGKEMDFPSYPRAVRRNAALLTLWF